MIAKYFLNNKVIYLKFLDYVLKTTILKLVITKLSQVNFIFYAS